MERADWICYQQRQGRSATESPRSPGISAKSDPPDALRASAHRSGWQHRAAGETPEASATTTRQAEESLPCEAGPTTADRIRAGLRVAPGAAQNRGCLPPPAGPVSQAEGTKEMHAS
jgi:hypothetical protein